MANLEQNEPMMEIYLMAEKYYLEKLLEYYPEDETIGSLIETIEFQISELNAQASTDATQTDEATDVDMPLGTGLDTEIGSDGLNVPFENETPSPIGDVDLDVSFESEASGTVN
jgi:hypothetical protein